MKVSNREYRCPQCGRFKFEYNHQRRLWCCLWHDCSYNTSSHPVNKQEVTKEVYKGFLHALSLCELLDLNHFLSDATIVFDDHILSIKANSGHRFIVEVKELFYNEKEV